MKAGTKMVQEDDPQQGLVLDGLMLCAWSRILPEQESIWRQRLQAALCTQKLLPRKNAGNATSADSDEEIILARLDHLESVMETVLRAVRFGPMSDPELVKQWLRMGTDGMEIRLAPEDKAPYPAGSLVHVKWVFPHLPDTIQECLCRLTRVDELDAGWKSMVLKYDFVDDEARDEIGRAAFLAQRLSRWSHR